MLIVNIAIPASTCQDNILKNGFISKPKLILMTKRIPRIPEIKKVVSNAMFQILLLIILVIIFLFDAIKLIR